jgi:hypothetical protein
MDGRIGFARDDQSSFASGTSLIEFVALARHRIVEMAI